MLTKGVLSGLSMNALALSKKMNATSSLINLGTLKIANIHKKASLIDDILKGTQGFHNSYLNRLTDIGEAAKRNSLAYTVALTGISDRLIEITKQNQALSEKIAKSFNSQIALSNKLVDFASHLKTPEFKNYNVLNVAVAGFSNNYLNTLIKNKDWDNFDDFNELTEKFESITDDYITEEEEVTIDYLDSYKESIILEFSTIYEKSKSDKIKQFIVELITLISFLLTFYSIKVQNEEISNREVVKITTEEIDRFKKEISSEIKKEFEQLSKMRIARTDVVLRYSNKKNSKRLGVVKKGQDVFVLEIQHKWLLISYIDNQTKEPKSGYVFKKYFSK